MNRILSISPWPSVWSQGEKGGAPSEAYCLEAMLKAGFEVTHLTPAAPHLPQSQFSGRIRFVHLPSNPFAKYRPILKSGIAFAYRLPAIMEFSRQVMHWLKERPAKERQSFSFVLGHSSESIYAQRRAAAYLSRPSISRLYGISAPLDLLQNGLRRELYFDLISLLRHPPEHLIITDDGTCGDLVTKMFLIPEQRYSFLMNGYETSILESESNSGVSPYVLTACRLVDWKRVDRVLHIAEICRHSLPDIKFIILGDGPERPRLKKIIKRLNISVNVKLLGKVSRKRMYDFLKKASVVLATQNLSNLNNTVLEALVMGKAIVTLNTGCTSKLIKHQQTGLLYETDDLEGCAQGVTRLMIDEKFREKLAKQAAEYGRRKLLTWPERIELEARIYRSFVSG